MTAVFYFTYLVPNSISLPYFIILQFFFGITIDLQILAKRFGNIISFPYLCTRNIKSKPLCRPLNNKPY